jgi:hypothetical protein
MKPLRLSRAASGLVRALLARAGDDQHRVRLSHCRSVDWQSLTFTGQRHCIELRVEGREAARSLADGLEEAEFEIAGQIVADIALSGPTRVEPDGTTVLAIEALTVAE